MTDRRKRLTLLELVVSIAIVGLALGVVIGSVSLFSRRSVKATATVAVTKSTGTKGAFEERYVPRLPTFDTSGYKVITTMIKPWRPDASLEEIADNWRGTSDRVIADIEERLAKPGLTDPARIELTIAKASVLNSRGEAEKAYTFLEEVRTMVALNGELKRLALGSLMYFQGVTALRRGENDNCVMCRGESSCILPIAPSAQHQKPAGSRLAIKHFSEYLERFPGDLEVRWLLNIAHMTVGEYPDGVDPRFRIDLNRFFYSEFDIGRFRDIGHLVGVNRFNQAGGAIMEDFDNDGLLDLAVSSFDATQPMSLYRNKGDGAFEDRSGPAGVDAQTGGLVCYQTDYNNDGWMDIYIPRGAWIPFAVRPTLLRNDAGKKFTDVTKEAGLFDPMNSNAAAWADYDNDGWVDLFVGCERQLNRLYHNKGDGTFEEVALKAGVQGLPTSFCKGCTWIDHDNDGYPDLFVNNLSGAGRLYRNARNGTFRDVTAELKIDGPYHGFSCWAWDYDNDGWLDIFATCYDRSVEDIVKGLIGERHGRYASRLFRNNAGKSFENRTEEAGLNMVFSTMGSNFGDFDNDGWLDMYLGTGEPSFAALVPNRMFKNVGGRRFSEITGSSHTGHLQKGHGVACGDWDRDGDVDIFVQTGGAVDGDKYHNILFQNPGQGNHWLTVKLVGTKTNRAAIGARIKVTTSGNEGTTVYRHVSSGSSFGANPLEQTVGLGASGRVAELEIHWPTSGTKQIFRDIAGDQSIEVTEFADAYRTMSTKPLAAPQ
jgi:hypothetical protein